MANPGAVPITLVTILLLVAPGFVAIRWFLRRSERKYTLDRTEKIVWSSAASLGSLLLLYVTSFVHLGHVRELGVYLSEEVGLVTGATIQKLPLSTGVSLYIAHILVLFSGSIVFAKLDTWRREDQYSERRPWYYAFNDVGDESIRVFLHDGSQIEGKFHHKAWDSSTKDLFIQDANWRSHEAREGGRSAVVSSDSVSVVVFGDSDPDEEPTEDVEPQKETANQVKRQIDEIMERAEQSDDESDSDTGTAEPADSGES